MCIPVQLPSKDRVFEKGCMISVCRCEQSVVILPGLGNASTDYSVMQSDLEMCGYDVETCVVRRVDWLRNAAGLTDVNYWKGTLNPRPTVDWLPCLDKLNFNVACRYLNRIEEALEKIKQRTNGAPITLLAHSVNQRMNCDRWRDACLGGWVAWKTLHEGLWYDRN